MVRNRKRRTNIELTSLNTMMLAVRSVLSDGWSVKRAANEFHICRTALSPYVEQCRDKEVDCDGALWFEIPRMQPKYNCCQVFTVDEERLVSFYLKDK
ncbi:hypothetical protein QE152_g30705 [Popillia japonica]|uniref:HTH psq-type domain-containing protein n=1 Tax=Popillia japonica TaxID=7064 RepID=A0AAW1JD04_POPJA